MKGWHQASKIKTADFAAVLLRSITSVRNQAASFVANDGTGWRWSESEETTFISFQS
jgi:hypothetical protein